jgi:hypothetical protein
MTILAREVLFEGEFPRTLRYRCFTLTQIASQRGMVFDGHDCEILRFTTLVDSAVSIGIAVAYLTSSFASLLRSGDELPAVARLHGLNVEDQVKNA